ncbi:stage II sporulation protein M [Butyrivibrio sp. M55]|uniref:stage II sporulation protein M n=1 Tax=Butyrivibrio sp. M55 TaxID=1855323 RepID=UPI0008E5BC0A|nr:stage II sporulation protein M [Butyrivibrio sp. M55]SFU95358.1 Stage II sporulation protein M [Butyrivibrio sp. M55]
MEKEYRDKVVYEYLLKYIGIFIFTILISYIINIGNEKCIANTDITINIIKDFFIILSNNTLVFLVVLSSIFVGKTNINIMIIVTAFRIGILISKFMYINYLILVIPHGVIEVMVYLVLSAFVSAEIEKGNKINSGLIKKAFVLYLLLIISAIVEIGITPKLARIFL